MTARFRLLRHTITVKRSGAGPVGPERACRHSVRRRLFILLRSGLELFARDPGVGSCSRAGMAGHGHPRLQVFGYS